VQDIKEAASEFLATKRVAVTGVSRDRKGGHGSNAVYRRLRHRGYEVFAVNPNADHVEGDRSYNDLGSIPGGVDAVVIGTRPERAADTMRECAELGIKHVWMHRGPGAGRSREGHRAHRVQLWRTQPRHHAARRPSARRRHPQGKNPSHRRERSRSSLRRNHRLRAADRRRHRRLQTRRPPRRYRGQGGGRLHIRGGLRSSSGSGSVLLLRIRDLLRVAQNVKVDDRMNTGLGGHVATRS
jgi:uncharacterized protein